MNHRTARPLVRDATRLRDDRLFIVACDDTFAPKQDFGFLRLPRVPVHVVPTTDGTSTAGAVLDRLLDIAHDEDDERWLLVDTDHRIQGPHLQGFSEALQRARQSGVNVALSRPCFELWLFLHHAAEDEVHPVWTATEVEAALGSKLGGYNKTKLREEHYSPRAMREAWERARRLDVKVEGGDIPAASAARVYKLLESIVACALRHQLPPELADVRRSGTQ